MRTIEMASAPRIAASGRVRTPRSEPPEAAEEEAVHESRLRSALRWQRREEVPEPGAPGVARPSREQPFPFC